MRTLLIEDDCDTAGFIRHVFCARGWNVDVANCGEDGVELAKLFEYDCIMLDLMLPDIDGFEVLKRLRAAHVMTPVIVVSGLSQVDKKVYALEAGADDYLCKPFNKDELVARVRAVIRRSRGFAESLIRVDELEVNLSTREVRVNGNVVYLTRKEYGIIELLALHKGRPVSRESLLNHLYDGEERPQEKTLDVYVYKLRVKLKKASGGKRYVRTVWGCGFQLATLHSKDSETIGVTHTAKLLEPTP
jgi:two-component system cell cycle response regulator CtrA